jgi:hypothetical protein
MLCWYALPMLTIESFSWGMTHQCVLHFFMSSALVSTPSREAGIPSTARGAGQACNAPGIISKAYTMAQVGQSQ